MCGSMWHLSFCRQTFSFEVVKGSSVVVGGKSQMQWQHAVLLYCGRLSFGDEPIDWHTGWCQVGDKSSSPNCLVLLV